MGPPRAAWEANGIDPEGGSPRFRHHVREIASLHRQLAQAYENLEKEADFGLAAWPGQSVHPIRMSPAPTAKPFLTTAEAAELLDYHPRTLRRLEVAGVVAAAVGSGRRKRWRRSELEKWDAEGRPGA